MRFKRKTVENYNSSPEQGEANRIDINQFIDSQAENILQSAALWQSVGARMNWCKTDPSIIRAFHEGVPAIFEATNVPINPVRVTREADRLVEELGTYTQIAVRGDDVSGNYIKKAVHFSRMLTSNLPGEGVPYIMDTKTFPKSSYLSTAIEMQNAMGKADVVSDEVLGALCEGYALTPEHIIELGWLYVHDAEETFPMLSELRKMITADWYRRDAEKSILRTHCRRLCEDPGIHVLPFCEAVNSEETFRSVATMARYAIISSGESDISESAIAKQLYSTRDSWSEVPDLQEAFNGYIDGVSTTVESAFQTIAGPRNLRNVRLERTEQEVLEIASRMTVYASLNSKDARIAEKDRSNQARAYRKVSRRAGAVDSLPSTDESVRQLDARELFEERTIQFAQHVNGRGIELQRVGELSEDMLIDRFKLEKNQIGIGQDMIAALVYLQQPTMSLKGVRRINHNLNLNGKMRGLWRLAPDKAPGLKVSSNNRFYRIVYTIMDKDVVVYDILSHADFDKRYS